MKEPRVLGTAKQLSMQHVCVCVCVDSSAYYAYYHYVYIIGWRPLRLYVGFEQCWDAGWGEVWLERHGDRFSSSGLY